MRRTYLSEDSEEENTPILSRKKILVLGDKAVGKTSFITRVTSGYFSMYYSPTKNIEIHREVAIDDMLVTFWDVPAHIKYHFKLESLKADAVILLFDTQKPESKSKALKMWDIMHQQMDHLPYVFMVGVRDIKDKEMGIHYIDNMSTAGLTKLLYAIRTTMQSYTVSDNH